MKETHYHFIEHLRCVGISALLSLIFSFFVTLTVGSFSVLICAVISSQILLGLIVYQYLRFGYECSPRERSSFKEFFLGMLPAQLAVLLLDSAIYLGFVFLYKNHIFESLPLHRLAANTPAWGFTFVLTDTNVLSLSEKADETEIIALPAYLPMVFLAVFAVFAVLCAVIAYLCYRRGVFLNDRERDEMLRGVTRAPKGSFAKRFRFFPIVNIFPLVSYISKHLFSEYYRLRDALIPLALIGIVKMLLDTLVSFAIYYVNTVWMYYLMHFLSLYLWGILISSIVSRREKKE